MKHISVRSVILCLLLLSRAELPAQIKTPSDAGVRKRLQSYVLKEKQAPGIVVGIVDKNGSRIVAAGVVKKGETNVVDGDTLFEIGSITKVFTTLLLQQMVDEGTVKLDDAIGSFLPATVKTPSRNGKQITLVDLATHTSGFPKLPSNLSTWHVLTHMDNPYADYTVTSLYEFLAEYKLKRDIGAKYEYSNVGVGLLGYLLSVKAGTNYETLVSRRICQPLKMDSTCIHLSPALQPRMAQGHSSANKPVPNWDDTPAMEACGALKSSMKDMLKFLAASMGAGECPFAGALTRSQVPRHETELGRQVGLGWHINTDGIIWHNGGTGGFRSFLGFSKQGGRGIVLLANSENDVDELAMELLGPARPHKPAQVDATIYDRYIGKYKLAPRVFITVTSEDGKFFAELTGQDKIEFFPESENEFFCKVVDAQLVFVTNGPAATAVILRQNGLDQKAPKQN